jgi:hypothetical protein
MATRITRNVSSHRREVGLDHVIPHLQTTLFVTGAFCVAWSWDLVVYASSHAWFGEDPLENQLSFGNQRAPKYLIVLLAQYMVVCGAAAILSNHYRQRQHHGGWTAAAIMAIEFFPSPVFAGKLMAYLGQFRFRPLQQALLNLGATWFAAFLSHVLSPSSSLQNAEIGFWQRTRLIIRDTLGFGLGIAWNVLLAGFGPDNNSQLNVMHFLALVSYLLMVLVIALKLAAMLSDNPVTLWERHLSLLAFAMYVVCAFTLVGFLKILLGDGWVSSLQGLGIVLALAAVMSTMVAVADLDEMVADSHSSYDQEQNAWVYKSSKFGICGGVLNCLIFVPCVWCCCPWIPLLILLAGVTEAVSVKEHWFKLIAMVAGLASSIEASGMLTLATDSLATALDICGHRHCHNPWMFVGLQVVMATLCTFILLPLIAPLAPSSNNSSLPATNEENVDAVPTTIPAPIPAPSSPKEDVPLLQDVTPMAPPPPVNPNYDPNRM